jgi:hypothetical protein
MRKLPLIASFILILTGPAAAQHSAFQSHIGRPNTSGGAQQAAPSVARPSVGSVEVIGGGGQAIGSEAAGAVETEGPAGGGVFVYDPYLDNHLRAPEKPLGTSLFGLRVSEAESIWRDEGARNNSYAFGKYSRLRLSKYLIELSFDKDKRVGAVKVSPVKPYTSLPPKAREYFMQIIMGDADVSHFKLSIASHELDIKYQGN